KVLLGGDAHSDRLCMSIRTLKKSAKALRLDAFKVPHHGSERSLSPELLTLIDCPRFLISTNSSYFKHPTPTAIARIIKFSGKNSTIAFNYRSKYTRTWDNAALKAMYGYLTQYPAKKFDGNLVVSL